VREAERSWGAVQRWLAGVLRWADVADVNSEELIVFPGLEEFFSLLQILRHAREGRFDVLVVDCAPTGETLRLLSYPNVLRWWLNRLFPFQRRMARLARPVARLVTGGVLPPPPGAPPPIRHGLPPAPPSPGPPPCPATRPSPPSGWSSTPRRWSWPSRGGPSPT